VALVPEPSTTDLFCERLEQLVVIDSPSEGIEQEQVAAAVAEWLVPSGCSWEWITEPQNPARSLSVELVGDGTGEVALLGHGDTVFGLGTAADRPFHREGARCTGPGVADMKGGLVLAAMAIEELARRPTRQFGRVRLLVCADEEVRLHAPAATALAAGSDAALVFECGRENGDIVSARKGAVWRTMELTGRPAHAGADTASGRSAVSALAAEVLRIEQLPSNRPAMTSVVTTVAGGDAANTVPGHARATIDIRSSDPADLDHALAELHRASPYDGVGIEIVDRGTWPPMPRSARLVSLALSHAAALGLDVAEQHSGGVSDGCWTGAAGVPTLDGLGPVGGRDHTPEEWIEVATLERRIELAVRLITSVCESAA
jgi:glutamate carboxypeptidase